jgi:tetratricopeptide (TPR) repeat protein
MDMEYIEVVENRLPVRISLKDIIYIEVYKKICMIHLTYGVVNSYITIDELEKSLGPETFVRCHRSYIVNMERVKKIEKGMVVLANGDRAFVSRRMQERTHDAYRDFIQSGKQIERYPGVPALFNNKNLENMSEAYAGLEKQYWSLRGNAQGGFGDENALYLQISRQKNELAETIHGLQKDIIAMETAFVEKANLGYISPRLTQSRSFFELGELETTKRILDFAEMSREDERYSELHGEMQKKIRIKINEYLYLIDVLKTDVTNPKRFDEIDGIYNQITVLEEKYNITDQVAAQKYADYLYYQKNYEKAVGVARDLLHRLRDEAAVADACHLMARCLNRLQRREEASKMSRQALDIREKLAAINPERYEPDLAKSLDNMARLTEIDTRFDDAEVLRKRALGIYERLAANNPVLYEPFLAKCCNNLAELYVDTYRFAEAEVLCNKALEIQKRLAKENPIAFTPHEARSYHDLAGIYRETNRPNESKELYEKSISMRGQLAHENPMAFEPDLVVSLNSFSKLCTAAGDYETSGKALRRGIHIVERLAVVNPDAYRPHVAVLSNNLAKVYEADERYADAQVLFNKALSICETFGDGKPLESFIIRFALNLGLVQVKTGQYAEAEKSFLRSLEVCEGYAIKSPVAYEPDLIKIYEGLADFYKTMERETEHEAFLMKAETLREKLK